MITKPRLGAISQMETFSLVGRCCCSLLGESFKSITTQKNALDLNER